MKKTILVASMCLAGLVHAQTAATQPAAQASKPTAANAVPTSAQIDKARVNAADRIKAVMDAMQRGDASALPADAQRAISTGLSAGEQSSKLEAPASTIDAAMRNNEEWQKASTEAFIAALPPKDRPLGVSILQGAGTMPGNNGRLYFFVSRSMPQSLLKAYALDALYTGAAMVVRGVRKGDTIKEYVEEAMNDFNTADGHALAGMEVNPNLFDMFKVDVVPAVVWTNLAGLDDVGAGCKPLPEGAAIPQVELIGPDDRPLLADRPSCAQANPETYYKVTGALNLPYVLDRFESAGLSKDATKAIRDGLAERNANVFQGKQVTVGRDMVGHTDEVTFAQMPRHILLEWKQKLESPLKVSRTIYGPTFSEDTEEDADYRIELEKKVRHGLGL